ncbi:hypothetical protein [Mucilaginibacter sp.]
MNTKLKIYKLLAGVLLYSLITHWNDAKKGFQDAINGADNHSTQNQYK